MRKIIFYLLIIISASSALASENCFLAQEGQNILKIEGECESRHAPESTFKIALSLIGFDSGILLDENNPSWPYEEKYNCFLSVCKNEHNPRTWMRDSCLWYSQILTHKLGLEKFNDYVTKLNYGNIDISGNASEDNGLYYSWISSSLQISPEEQVEFLQNIINQKFPISKEGYNKTKNIMFIQELPGGWKMYGKTGNGSQLSNDKLQHGWFVGYIEKDKRNIVFVSHIVDQEAQGTFASLRAKNEALIKLWYLINEIEK